MKLSKGSGFLTLVLALLTSVGPLSTDMYLPSLPAIGRGLQASTVDVQLTLSVFLAGFAVGQIIYGPLSDKFGRLPVLAAGLTLFVIGSLACAFARDIDLLIVARAGQAIGASAAIVLARAIVRDLYSGSEAARLLSFMGALMGLVPLIAPVFGGVLEVTFGWRANFVVSTLLAVALLAIVSLFLPETLPPENRGRWTARGMWRDFGDLLTNGTFNHYLVTICLGYAGLFCFISASSFVLQKVHGLNEIAFGLSFAFCVSGYILGTLVGARLTGRVSVPKASRIGTLALGSAGLLAIVASLVIPDSVAGILVPCFLYFFGIGLVLPQGMAGALTPFPEKAGTASSLIGFLQMTSAAIIGASVARFIDAEPRILAWSIGILGIVNLLFSYAHRHEVVREAG